MYVKRETGLHMNIYHRQQQEEAGTFTNNICIFNPGYGAVGANIVSECISEWCLTTTTTTT